MRRTCASMLGGCLLAIAAGGFASADVGPLPPAPAPLQPLAGTLQVDFGPLADRIGERYAVAARDTLHSIARKYATDGGAWKALAAANRTTLPDPDRLRVGDVLWIPPKARLSGTAAGRVTPAVAPGPDYALFWVLLRGDKEILRHGQGTKVPERVVPGSLAICLVPAESAAALLKLADGAERPLGSTAATAGAASAPIDWPVADAAGSDATVRIEVRARVKGIEGSRLIVDTDVVRYDAGGSVIAKAPPPEPPTAKASEPLAEGPAASRPAAPLLAAPEETPANEGRFPVTLAMLVAGGGLLLLLATWFLRSKPAPPPEA